MKNLSTKKQRAKKIFSERGLTLVEILLVISLVTMVGTAIYKAMSDGIKIWQRNRSLMIEEDVAIFFEKMAQDIRNSFVYSRIPYKGNEYGFSFATIVHTPADTHRGYPPGTYVDQIGKVEYFYDLMDDVIYRRQANYSQALKNRYGLPRPLVKSVTGVRFNYYFVTDEGEIKTNEAFGVYPDGVEVEVEIEDEKGKRVMTKFFQILSVS